MLRVSSRVPNRFNLSTVTVLRSYEGPYVPLLLLNGTKQGLLFPGSSPIVTR